MKFVSWNVNGIRACIKPKTDDEGNVVSKGFEAYFKEIDADFFCIQETKMQAGQLDLQFDGYQSYWNYAERKGYSGTAIFARHEPMSVSYGLGIDELDHEGRAITLEYPDFYLITVYTPNSQDTSEETKKPKRLPFRMEWEDALREYMMRLDQKKPVIICGDMNVAHEEIDLKNPSTNHNNAGFTDEEREKMTVLLGSGFIDTFRALHPEDIRYSWWSYRFQARKKNVGWRIDYFLASERLKDKITDAHIMNEVYGSDHCPVVLGLDL